MFLSKSCHLLVICIAFLIDATYSIFYIDHHFRVNVFTPGANQGLLYGGSMLWMNTYVFFHIINLYFSILHNKIRNFCTDFTSATSGSERLGRMTEIPAAMWHIM